MRMHELEILLSFAAFHDYFAWKAAPPVLDKQGVDFLFQDEDEEIFGLSHKSSCFGAYEEVQKYALALRRGFTPDEAVARHQIGALINMRALVVVKDPEEVKFWEPGQNCWIAPTAGRFASREHLSGLRYFYGNDNNVVHTVERRFWGLGIEPEKVVPEPDEVEELDLY